MVEAKDRTITISIFKGDDCGDVYDVTSDDYEFDYHSNQDFNMESKGKKWNDFEWRQASILIAKISNMAQRLHELYFIDDEED